MAQDNNRDESIILRVEHWAVRGEPSPRTVLHVHGDEAAWAVQHKVRDAFVALAQDSLSSPRLDLQELDAEVRRIGDELGLVGYAGEAKCRADPLDLILDASLYRRPAAP